MSKSWCQVECDGKEYYLLTTSHDRGHSGFDLALCDGKSAWCGAVSEDAVDELSRSLQMDVDQFVTESYKALTQENVGSLQFRYEIKPVGKEAFKFLWKKYIPKEKIKIQLGHVILKKSNDISTVVTSVFSHAVDMTETYNEKIKNLQRENKRLERERAEALEKADVYLKVKDELETDLYSKFVVIVNEKKAKIRSLKEEMEALRNGTTLSSQESVRPSTSKHDGRQTHMEESDEESRNGSDSEYLTDDEVRTSSPIKKPRIKQEVLDTVDDLLDDMDEVKQEPAANKRARARGNRRAAPKQTPSKPVIPRVSSDSKTPIRTPSSRSSSRTPSSLKKVTSNISDTSNAEDLMDIL